MVIVTQTQTITTDLATRMAWEPAPQVRGTRRFVEYAKRFLSLASCTDEESFRQKLARSLFDIERVEIIFKQYKNLLARVHFSERMRIDFESWLVEKSIFIGSRFYDHNLIYEALPYLASSDEFQKVYEQFVRAITPSETVSMTKKYTILFTGQAGGGHRMSAQALATHLENSGNEIQLIDIDLLESRYLPQACGYSRRELYDEVYQRQQNPARATQLLRHMLHNQPLQAKCYLGEAKKMIAQFQPTRIFSVAHHKPELTYLSFLLGIPMTVVHTDYLFHQLLLPILTEQAKLKRALVHCTAPTDELLFFENMFQELHITNELPLAIMSQFQRLDFPIRDHFTCPTAEEISAIRTRLGIQPTATVCKIAMGQSGITTLIQTILRRLVEELRTTPMTLHVFVICGRNRELYNTLQASSRNAAGCIVDVRGFLEAEEMAEIDKVSDVWITKPGGSTSTELLNTRKQMLYLLEGNHPWEQANARYLELFRLAAKLTMKKSIIGQIRNRIAAHRNLDLAALPQTNWKHQINKIILK